RGDHVRDRHAVDGRSPDSPRLQECLDEEPVLVGRLLAPAGETPRDEQTLAVEHADLRVGVADVGDEQHRPASSGQLAGTGALTASPELTAPASTRLMEPPTIVTTDDPVRAEPSESAPPRRDSSRMPAIFRPATRTSFGHLSRASTRATRRSASATATAVVSDKVESSDCGRRGRTM